MNKEFKINGKIIETERLILRAFKEDDLNDFFEYASVDGVGEMAGWRHHSSTSETKTILDIFINHDITFAITLKENGKVIGSIGIEKYPLEDKLTEFNNYYGRELGFVLSKDYWGRGLMTEAVKATIDYLFNELDLDFLICGYFTFNSRSKRVQEKCGFIPYRVVKHINYDGAEITTILNLLSNPRKNIEYDFSHEESLLIKKI